jgi:hypothetical protein
VIRDERRIAKVVMELFDREPETLGQSQSQRALLIEENESFR